ncbi:hypothetical protein GQ44DRAFT_730565 [Phaeosphaeriaceae sp. PMI808]|nr:hypothetical protein GQ44DRAFT_730565 [Phaeosphaeriaceae sp. PMI808]
MPNRFSSGYSENNPYNHELHTRHKLQDAHHLQYLQLLFGLTNYELLKYPGCGSYCRYAEASLEALLGDDYHELWQILNLPRPRTAHDCWPWIITVLESINLQTKRPEDISIASVLKIIQGEFGAAAPSDKTFPQIAIFAALSWVTMMLTPTLKFPGEPHLACKLPGRLEAEGGAQHRIGKCKKAISVAFRGFKTEAWGPLVLKCGEPHLGESEDLYEASLCYKSLQTFSKISIQWVTTMTAHLDFDPASRKLSLFRFPTMCVLKAMQQTSTSSVLDRYEIFLASYLLLG